jgi:hypothetical protein
MDCQPPVEIISHQCHQTTGNRQSGKRGVLGWACFMHILVIAVPESSSSPSISPQLLPERALIKKLQMNSALDGWTGEVRIMIDGSADDPPSLSSCLAPGAGAASS